jgi:ribosomal protein L11 methyltransferase
MAMMCPAGIEPYKDLYIYLLNGRLSRYDEHLLGRAFLGNWVEGGNSFLFFSRPSREVVAGISDIHPGLELVEEHYFSYEEWQGGENEAIRVGRFLIIPPWVEREAAEGVIEIFLDPGVVFGNCLHPTTRDCLKALCLIAARDRLDRVLDLGTGTGILAIAAALLGAKKVVAIDVNPLCVEPAGRNVGLNHLEEKIRVVEGSAEEMASEPADLVLANIHCEVIKGLLKRRSFREKKRLIISGLMRSQYQDVRSELERRDFRIVRAWDHEMTWYTVLAVKKEDANALRGKDCH